MAKRLLVFAFGIAVYLFFLLTMLYGIGFIGNLVVPKGIDDGVLSPLFLALPINLFLIALFALQHSLMARQTFKQWWTRWLPEPIERSLYVLCASMTLWLLMWQWRPIPTYLWHSPAGWPTSILTVAFWAGWAMLVVSTFLTSHVDLFGLRQVYLYLLGVPYTPIPFNQSGLYGVIRHPMILSTLIAFWATPRMSIGHFVFAAGMTSFAILGIWFEERDLRRSFGDEYDIYRHQVPMFFPFLRKR